MNPLNKAFLSVVNHERNKFLELLFAAKIQKMVYPSKHFFERVVERNLKADDVLFMLVPVIKEFRVSTYNSRVFVVHWKANTLVASFETGVVTGTRRIVLKTMFEKNDDLVYDVEIRL